MHVAILHPCHCCGHPIDMTLPENRGLLTNKRASLAAQVVLLMEMIAHCKTAQKLLLKIQLDKITQELKGLP